MRGFTFQRVNRHKQTTFELNPFGTYIVLQSWSVSVHIIGQQLFMPVGKLRGFIDYSGYEQCYMNIRHVVQGVSVLPWCIAGNHSGHYYHNRPQNCLECKISEDSIHYTIITVTNNLSTTNVHSLQNCFFNWSFFFLNQYLLIS